MRNAKTLMVALVAVFAFSAVAASGAWATPPEFTGTNSICHNVGAGAGSFTTKAKCEKNKAELAGSGEWESNRFAASGGEAELISEAGTVICKTVATANTSLGVTTGQISAPKLGFVTVVFKECSLKGFACENIAAGTIKTEPLEMVLGFIPSTTKDGIALKPVTGTVLAEFACKLTIGEEKLKVEGSVIGEVTPLNTSTKKFNDEFTQTGGKQTIQMLEGELVPDVLDVFVGNVNEHEGREVAKVKIETTANMDITN